MSGEARIYVDNGYFHIIVRGNQKQPVFKELEDYSLYIKLLKKYKRKYSFKLYGYCLMPNHVHIVGQAEKSVNLSKFMQALNRAYTGCFNKKYEKVGHLWQGRFKSRVMVNDEYFINCINYIECNPVRASIVTSPEQYRWSSYKERIYLDHYTTMLDPV